MTRKHHELDSTDMKLLMLLQADGRRSSRALAAALSISPSSVQRRIRLLIGRGVISRFTALLDPVRVGRRATFVVNVWLHHETVRAVQHFKRQMLAVPEVTHCYHVTGDHTFVLIVSLPDIHSFSQFAERVFNSNPDVQRFNTSVAITVVKSHGGIPVRNENDTP
jgi:Lrp/AsnC family transcriptional regulator, leucine-responsive regulatory protein